MEVVPKEGVAPLRSVYELCRVTPRYSFRGGETYFDSIESKADPFVLSRSQGHTVQGYLAHEITPPRRTLQKLCSGSSPIRKRTPVRPCRKPMFLRLLGGLKGFGVFL